jgi:hypothetical protein
MAKKKKNRKKRKTERHKRNVPPGLPPTLSGMDTDEVHSLLPGKPPSSEEMVNVNEIFRNELRKSPIWDEMVAKFGAEEAEKLLQQVKIEVKGRG